MRRRVMSTGEIVDVNLELSAIYKSKKDNRRFKDYELETYFPEEHHDPKEIPYFVIKYIDDAIRQKVPPLNQLEMLPNGNRCTPMGLGTRMRVLPGSGEWEITITDWYGDRSQITVVEHRTGVSSLKDIIYYSLRDILHFVNVRCPGDEYLVSTIRKITEFAPELLELQYFKNNKFLTNV